MKSFEGGKIPGEKGKNPRTPVADSAKSDETVIIRRQDGVLSHILS
jgi:hypothetical protein